MDVWVCGRDFPHTPVPPYTQTQYDPDRRLPHYERLVLSIISQTFRM